MPDSTIPRFEPFDWTVSFNDPNDRLLASLVTNKIEDGATSGAILYGLPFDGAVLGRRGAAGGPRALRTAAKTLKTSYRDGANVFVELQTRVLDAGDAVLPKDDVAKAHAEAEKAARYIKALADVQPGHKVPRVIALGGDHSLTYPSARPYLEEHGEDFAVINLDAHLDIRRVISGAPQNSGTSFRRLLDKGLKRYIAIGVREWQTSPVYISELLKTGGCALFTADDVFTKGVADVCRSVLNDLSPECQIYLSVDLDVADACVAPGVSAPTPGGLLAQQVLELVRRFSADPRVIAGDIVEFAPNLEAPNSDRTARLGAAVLAQMLTEAANT